MNAVLAASIAVAPLTVALVIIDIRRQIIPDFINFLIGAIGLGSVTLMADERAQALSHAIVQGAIAYAVFWSVSATYRHLRGRTGLGLGDVKFIAAASTIIGLAGLPLMILVASLSGLLAIVVAARVGRRIDAQTRVPFGPFLVLGFYAAAISGWDCG